MVWWIGDGKTVSLKEDKCLLDQVYRLVSSPLPSIPPDAKVSILIDEENGTWKKVEIKQNFLPHGAKKILSILLSTRLPQDSPIWSKTPSGIFSTQSIYKLLVNKASTNSLSSSNPHPQRHLWRGVWMLRTPNKVKHFTWRACNNSLPTMDNLFRWHITPSACCNTCQTQTKDILHVVWGCLEVAQLWSTINWMQHTIPHLLGDFSNLFFSFLQVRDDYRVEIFAISAWLL